MVSGTLQAAVDGLSDRERLELADYLVRSVDGDEFELTSEQTAIVQQRIAEVEADPSIGITWEEIERRFAAKWG